MANGECRNQNLSGCVNPFETSGGGTTYYDATLTYENGLG